MVFRGGFICLLSGLSDEIESRLDSLAKQTGRTKTFAAGSNTGASGRLEDYYLSAETAARVLRRGDRSSAFDLKT